jgi:CRISPR-associated protein Csb2
VVGLAFRFDLGRYHATPWGTHVNDGQVEWPPSCWRILRALYAVSRTNCALHAHRAGIDIALGTLATAAAPCYVLPPTETAHTRHYYPSRLYSPTRQGATDRVLDAFRAVAPEAELEVWWDAELDRAASTGLAAAAAALGHLGRSESICTGRLLTSRAPDRFDAAPVLGDGLDDAELVQLLCPGDDADLATLTVSVGALRSQRRLMPPGTQMIEYVLRASVGAAPGRPTSASRPTLARFRLTGGGRPGIREAVAVGSAMRHSLQGIFGARHDHAASAIFSGRAGDEPRQDQHRHAHYLATTEDGRRIDHVTVWAPEGFGSHEVGCLANVGSVRLAGLPEPLRVALTALGCVEDLVLPQLLGCSKRWRSLTPFGLIRHPKRRGGLVVDGPKDQIRRELAVRGGFPEPINIELCPGAWLEFRRTRPFVSRLEAARVVGAHVTFPEPVRGPVALGALCHFGLGLFVPASS